MKRLCFVLIFASVTHFLFAQDAPEEKKGFQKEKLFVGGNFGLTFGDYTLIDVSPQVGYRFNHHLAAGLGINGQYISEKFYDYNQPAYKISRGVAGFNIFGRVYPIDQLFIQVQPETNYVFGNIKYYNPPLKTKIDSKIVPSLLLGGGAALPAGRGAFIISIFYDVLQNTNSPYGARPIYNFGYNFSL